MAPPSLVPVRKTQPARPLPEPSIRQSLGMEQFFSNLEARESLRILDLSGATQANINFALQYGHHLYCEDVVRTMESVFGDGDDFYERQADDDRMEDFLAQTFANLQGPFDGALLWDTLQFLEPPLIDHVVGHLHRILEPGALVFALFPADEKMRWLTVNSYRIESSRTMRLIPRSYRRVTHTMNSRALERLFCDFSSVKFFLTRDQFREVIVRR